MLSSERIPLTPGELKVMKIVCRHNACSARSVSREAGPRHAMAPSMVETHLRRLAEKGHLTTRRVGRGFVYERTRIALRSLQVAAGPLLRDARGRRQVDQRHFGL